MKKAITLFVLACVLMLVPKVLAQTPVQQVPAAVDPFVLESSPAGEVATAEATGTPSADQQKQDSEIAKIKKQDVTQPEQGAERSEILQLFAKRPVTKLTLSNFFEYTVQYAVSSGVPANTILLVLLLPMLATMVAFVRHVVGLPTLGLYVPIALSITFVATGVTAGLVLLIAIILASTLAKTLLKPIKIMQLPKVALSMFLVALVIFATLTFSAKAGILVVKQLSIFPVLLLILLSERVVELQLERSLKETLQITVVTCLLGIIGFGLLTAQFIQDTILLYPEFTLILIPANLLIGRYFGLRLTEYYRFSPLRNASK
jgi:hypothetical protein